MKFGPRVIGEEQFQKEQQAEEVARKAAYAYGPRVTGEAPAETAERPVKKPAGPAHVLSVKELEKALKANPSEKLLDELIAAEFARPEGQPRKGALRLLLQAEQDRGDAAREAVITELQGALEA
jgi:hypothetical protein